MLWSVGPPMLPTGYNNNYLILQTPDYVVIHVEMIHDTRIIPLDGRPRLGQPIPQWLGEMRGRWEGDTLVVETRDIARSAEGSSFGNDVVRIPRRQRGPHRELARGRTVHAGRRRHPPLRVHHRGSDALDEPVVRRAAAAADRRVALRVRLPRGQLQHRQHTERRPGGRADGRQGYVALSVDLLKLAWRNIGRNRRRTVVTVAAMAFGLFTMVVWFALFQGMLVDMERTVIDVEIGDLQIHAPSYLDEPSLYTVIDDVDTLIPALEAAGFRASPQLVGGGLVAAGVSAAGATLRGVNVRNDARVSAIPTRVAEGTWLDADDPAGVVVGRRLARSLDVAIDDEVVVLSQATDGSMANDLYAVRGILQSVSDGVDRSAVFLTEAAFRELFVMPSGAHRIVVRKPDDLELPVAVETVQGLAPDLDARSWRALPADPGDLSGHRLGVDADRLGRHVYRGRNSHPERDADGGVRAHPRVRRAEGAGRRAAPGAVAHLCGVRAADRPRHGDWHHARPPGVVVFG